MSIIAVVGVIIGLLSLVLFGTLYYAYKTYYASGNGKSNTSGSGDGHNVIPLQELLRTAGDTGTDHSLPLFQSIPRISNVFKSTTATQQQQDRSSLEIRVEDQYMTGIYNQGGDLSVEENPTKYARPTLSGRPESPSLVNDISGGGGKGGGGGGAFSIMNVALGSSDKGGMNSSSGISVNPFRSSQTGIRPSTSQFKQ